MEMPYALVGFWSTHALQQAAALPRSDLKYAKNYMYTYTCIDDLGG